MQKSEACEVLLADITEKTKMGEEKKEMAQTKSVEMEQQNKVSKQGSVRWPSG